MADNNFEERFLNMRDIVAEQLNIEDLDIIQRSTSFDELDADSLDIIELVMKFEYEYDLDIEDLYASKIRTIQQVLDYMEDLEKFS